MECWSSEDMFSLGTVLDSKTATGSSCVGIYELLGLCIKMYWSQQCKKKNNNLSLDLGFKLHET